MQEYAPVVTRLRWPPLMPRTIALPTCVSPHTCAPEPFFALVGSHAPLILCKQKFAQILCNI